MQVPCPSCQAPIPVPIFALGPLDTPVPVLCPRCRQPVELRQGANGGVTATAAPQKRPQSGAADSFFQGSASSMMESAGARRPVPQRSRDAEMLREFSVMFRQAATRNTGTTVAVVIIGLLAAAGTAFGVWWYMNRQAAVEQTDDVMASAVAWAPDPTTGPGSPLAPNSSQLAEHLQTVSRDARLKAAGRPVDRELQNHPPQPSPQAQVAAPQAQTPSSALVLEPVNRRQLDSLCHSRTSDVQACAKRFANGAAVEVHFTVNVIGQIEAVRAEVDGTRLTELTVCVAEILRTSKFGYQPEDVHHSCEFKGLVPPAPRAPHGWKQRHH